jgi:hypothetical protein
MPKELGSASKTTRQHHSKEYCLRSRHKRPHVAIDPAVPRSCVEFEDSTSKDILQRKCPKQTTKPDHPIRRGTVATLREKFNGALSRRSTNYSKFYKSEDD